MLSLVFVAAGTVTVIVAEKAPGVLHAPEKIKIIVGVAFGLPFLLLALWAEARARKAKAQAAAPQRPAYPFGNRRA